MLRSQLHVKLWYSLQTLADHKSGRSARSKLQDFEFCCLGPEN